LFATTRRRKPQQQNICGEKESARFFCIYFYLFFRSGRGVVPHCRGKHVQIAGENRFLFLEREREREVSQRSRWNSLEAEAICHVSATTKKITCFKEKLFERKAEAALLPN
jgi:hypothetical protein